MKRKIKNFLIRLNLFQTLKFIIGLFQVVRIKLLFPQLVFKSISLKYKIAFFSDETIIENLLRERNLYHPVSDYNFSAINAINKKSYAYVIQSNNENILIPFLHYYDNTGGGIIILINYSTFAHKSSSILHKNNLAKNIYESPINRHFKV
jgi:hypothetical protein